MRGRSRLALISLLLASGCEGSFLEGRLYREGADGGAVGRDADVSEIDGAIPGMDGAIPGMDGAIPGTDGSWGADTGVPGVDATVPGADAGLPDTDAGGALDSGTPPVDAGPVCGNGMLDGTETCDPPSSCPSSCDDGMACTADTRTGGASTCDVRCSHAAITACTAGDGCCPAACSVATDSDCTPACGDGVCTSGETCASCAADCGACACGDGLCTASAGELCTSCGADCNTRSSVCGNGECQSGETSASCMSDCGPSPWSGSWATWEDEVVTLFNMHRAAGTDCPSGAKSAVGPVTMDSALRTAARLHSWDQSYSGYFSHTSCNGRTFTQRASAQGTSAYGEIIASGQTSPAAAVAAWMASTSGHCDIIMNGSYGSVGVGYAQASGGGRLWTGMFR